MKTKEANSNINTRGFVEGNIELRSEGGNDYVEGMAVSFETLSSPMMEFSDGSKLYERIKRGALDGCDMTDVVCLRDHRPDLMLGRSKSGTLSLTLTDTGLAYKCLLPKMGAGAETRELLERKDITGSSFSWPYDAWEYQYTELDNGDVIREITKISKLRDVSPVVFPAYPSSVSSLSKRSFLEQEGAIAKEELEEPKAPEPEPEKRDTAAYWKYKNRASAAKLRTY